MSQAGESFFTSVGCMDGRVQKPILEFGLKKFNAIYPDTITEAGLVGLLGKQHLDKELVESIEKKIKISLEKHNSKGIIVNGHENCAASDAVSEKQHKEDVLNTAELIRLMFPKVSVLPVYVKKVNDFWTVEEL